MGNKHDTDDLCPTTDFDFASPDGQRQFHQDSCDVVDAEGSEAELRFKAVRELGERIQEKCETSKKSLRNIYNFVVATIIKGYGFSDAHEPILRSMLIVYWKRGHELRAAFEKQTPPSKILSAQEDWDRTCDRVERTAEPESDLYPEPPTYIPYSSSREAGPG